jgi:hypothetical protein
MTAVNQWTVPKTITGGTRVTTDFMNTFLRDNFTFLKSPPTGSTSVSGVTTTSTSFVAMTGSSFSITTTGGYILFWSSGRVQDSTGGAVVTIDLSIDGIQQGHATFGTALLQGGTANYSDNMNCLMLTAGGAGGSLLAAGAHSCSLAWKVSAGTGTANLLLYAWEIC